MPMEVMDYNQMILETECKYWICVFLYNMHLFSQHSLLVSILIHSSPLAGGGAGSGGAVSFSACTLTAGSSAKIEAKGGDGGRGRNNNGTRLLCVVFV